MKFYILSTLLLLTSFFVNAQISLFKDINSADEGSYPSNFIEFNSATFFTIKTAGNNAYKLWKTDGTEAGTVQASEQNIYIYTSSLRKFLFLATDTHLYYSAKRNDSQAAMDIWRTDGTTHTLMIENIKTNADLIILNNEVYYFDYNGLFKINENGDSTLIKSLPPIAEEKAVIVNNEIFFFIKANARTQLWKSNGTEAGTVLIQEIDAELFYLPGSLQENPRYIVINNTVFFFLSKFNNSTNKYEGHLWKSNGSSAGTVLIKQVLDVSNFYGITINSLTNFNNNLVFNIGLNLWISDGTETGTQILKTFQGINGSLSKRKIGVLGEKFFFSASVADNDYELWESDGTISGTNLFKNLNLNQSSNPNFFVTINNRLLFRANKNNELWQSDGTPEGTTFVLNIPKPDLNVEVQPEFIYTSNHILFFQNYDPQHNFELWKSDGTPQNTGLLKNIITGARSSLSDDKKIKVGNTWYFMATDYRGSELWKSDGTPEGTTIVKDIIPGADGMTIYEMVSIGNIVYFTFRNNGNTSVRLGYTGGTEANTFEIDLNVNDNNISVNPFSLTVANNKLFFLGDKSGIGITLWTLNGTQATSIHKSDPSGFYPQNLVGANGKLYFSNSGLWESDGTEAGTKRVYPFTNNAINIPYDPRNLTELKNKLYFVSRFTNENSMNLDGLFEISGNNNETKIIKEFDFDEDLVTNFVPFMVKTEDLLFFRTKPTNLGNGKISLDLWASNGTSNGTFFLKKLFLDMPNRFQVVPVNNKLFILSVPSYSEGSIGFWATDGTIAGTQELTKPNIKPTYEGIRFKNKLYFSQYDKDHGSELWTSDGTTIGTYLVDEVQDGKKDSFASNFLNFDDKMIFWGYDEIYGNEPRKYSGMNCEGNRNYSLKSGNWDLPDTWSCGHVPTQNEIVIIKSGHHVSIPLNYRAYTNVFLTETGSVLTIPASAILISTSTIP
jgi:ELWxxDGT repeat protein